jgi:hypothetical protein
LGEIGSGGRRLGRPGILRAGLAQTCRAPAPAVGQTVSGPVLHVIDGRTLCIAQGPTPDRWIALRISPAGPPCPPTANA